MPRIRTSLLFEDAFHICLQTDVFDKFCLFARFPVLKSVLLNFVYFRAWNKIQLKELFSFLLKNAKCCLQYKSNADTSIILRILFWLYETESLAVTKLIAQITTRLDIFGWVFSYFWHSHSQRNCKWTDSKYTKFQTNIQDWWTLHKSGG